MFMYSIYVTNKPIGAAAIKGFHKNIFVAYKKMKDLMIKNGYVFGFNQSAHFSLTVCSEVCFTVYRRQQ